MHLYMSKKVSVGTWILVISPEISLKSRAKLPQYPKGTSKYFVWVWMLHFQCRVSILVNNVIIGEVWRVFSKKFSCVKSWAKAIPVHTDDGNGCSALRRHGTLSKRWRVNNYKDSWISGILAQSLKTQINGSYSNANSLYRPSVFLWVVCFCCFLFGCFFYTFGVAAKARGSQNLLSKQCRIW